MALRIKGAGVKNKFIRLNLKRKILDVLDQFTFSSDVRLA